jgi:hypothetical protein
MSIPTTLTIYINTSIPGSQFIKYSPTMTIPNIDSKNVYFNPLVKLSQKIIDKTPKQDIVTQFFEKGLFKTLIIRSEQFTKPRTLRQAVEKGFIDNNIEITLKNIFKSNNLFYIHGQPYTIYSFDWEKGNWKIDTKISEVPSTYKGQYGINTVNYRTIMEEQLRQAKRELNSLPKDLTHGSAVKESTNVPIVQTPNPSLVSSKPSSNLSYYIDITLQLYPGKEIPLSERPSIGCRNTKHKLNKAWAELLGKTYSLQPHYYPSNKKKANTQNNPKRYGGKSTTRKKRRM